TQKVDDITDTHERYQVKSSQKGAKYTAAGGNGIEGSGGAADSGKLSRRQTYDVGRDGSQKNSRQQEVDTARDQRIQPGTEIDTGNQFINGRVDKGQKKNQNPRNHQE